VELAAALAAGADHAGFGSIAPSTTKPDTTPADPAELRACLDAFPDVPIFPIGGLGPATLGLVTRVGCRRAAVGSAVLDAPDPAAAAATLLAGLLAGPLTGPGH
jgi:thiamine monophosphate synthase